MKTFLLIGLLSFFGLITQAQSITGHQLLPANATANDNLKLVLTVEWGNCGRSLNYSFTRTGNVLALDACLYGGPAPAIGCIKYDTVRIGRLPAGTYTVNITRYLSFGPSCAPGGTPYGALTSLNITVGLALANRAASANWQFSPTVLPASESVLHLTNGPELQQISIYDLTGREKVRFDASTLITRSDGLSIPVPQLEPALYLLRITDRAGQTSTQRFVRQ